VGIGATNKQSRFSHREVLFTRPKFDGGEADSGAVGIFARALRLGPAVHNQSFDLAPAVSAFLCDPNCVRELRRYWHLGRDVEWFQRVFALMVGSIDAAAIRDCCIPPAAAASSNGGGGGAGGSGGGTSSEARSSKQQQQKQQQGPFTAEALRSAIARLSVDPLRMMVQDMSMPELVMLIAARHCTQATVDTGAPLLCGWSGGWWWLGRGGLPPPLRSPEPTPSQ
jgi:hypothetical protein